MHQPCCKDGNEQHALTAAADLNRNIEVDNKAITNYRDLLVNLLFLRRLPPWHANVGKRLAKMEKGQC